MKILLTGGLGFIGSHTCISLIDTFPDVEIIIIDNLSNSKSDVLRRLKLIKPQAKITFYKVDLFDLEQLDMVFQLYSFDYIIHFAGLKSVPKSLKKPIDYYGNVTMTLNLLKMMEKHNCFNLVFSSSSTVYGDQESPYHESMKINMAKILTPYGKSKYIIEELLRDIYKSNIRWKITILRYFNPIGSHSSGLLIEDPNNDPTNLMPLLIKSVKNNTVFSIYGTDYDTKDGTCIRDFTHVMDVADSHAECLYNVNGSGSMRLYNVGMGDGKASTVLELINMFEEVNNIKVNYQYVERREGDIPAYYSSTNKIKAELNWEAKRTLQEACKIHI